MRLEELTPTIIRRAVEIYMRHAWPEGYASDVATVFRPMFDPGQLASATSVNELFACCEKARIEDDGPLFARYTLRLGNSRYPFMKFVVQEYLVHREYFFSVDTHDEHISVRPDRPEYQEFLEVRRENRRLKIAIEADWERAGLPTHKSLLALAQGLAREEREDVERGLVLVVDDEVDVALSLASLLAARGYRVETVYDGRQVLERLERDPLPDLVLLDVGMPELDGEEVLQRMRANPRTRELPVLLATAASIDLARVGRVSGLLRKPYPRAVLYALLERLLALKRAAGGAARG